MPDNAVDLLSGDPLEIWTEYKGFNEDIFTFYETVKNIRTEEVVIHEKFN